MFVRPLLLIFATLLTGAVQASPCADDRASGCAKGAAQQTENEMDILFERLLKQHGRGSVLNKRLINAQRTWHSFRDAECEYLTTYGEQLGRHGQNYDRCLQAMTEQRIQVLLHYQQCDAASDGCTVHVP